jgi:CBS domain-containing protein
MKVSALFHRTVTSCTDRDTLEHAASLLWRQNIGCLPVLGDDGRLIGMLTDRDIAIAALLQGAPLRSITVSSVMVKEVLTCQADDEIETVVEGLLARRLRRMPVIDADRRVIGILSLNDIARAAIAHQLPTAGIAAVLAAIAVPRSLAATAS